jgi:hypothetical protein
VSFVLPGALSAHTVGLTSQMELFLWLFLGFNRAGEKVT